MTTLDITRARTFVADLKKVDVNKVQVPVVGGHAGTTILPLLSQNNLGLTFTQEEIEALTKRIQFGGDEVVEAKAGAGSATLSMAYAGAEFTFSVLRALNGAANVVECTFVQSTVTDSPFFASKVQLGVSIAGAGKTGRRRRGRGNGQTRARERADEGAGTHAQTRARERAGAPSVFHQSLIVPNVRVPFRVLQKDGVEKIHGLGKLTAFEEKKLAEMLPELKKSVEKGVAFVKGA